MSILSHFGNTSWFDTYPHDVSKEAVAAIENGKILYFPNLDFQLLPHEEEFFSPSFAHPKAKNISFSRTHDSLRCAPCSHKNYLNLKAMLHRYSNYAEQLVRTLLNHYSPALQLCRTSFRPVEIEGRVSSYRKDDTRLHVDAFPATPNQGRRILRVFCNINPHGQARQWRVGESFSDVAHYFLPLVRKQWPGLAALLKWLKITKSKRTAYDHIMLQIHDNMKADLNYQTTASQQHVRFAPGTSWIVQTDHVSHAAMAGQYVLEQTFYLPVTAMLEPELSPLKVLEKLTRRKLV